MTEDEAEVPETVVRELRAARSSRHPRPRGMLLIGMVETALGFWAVGAGVLWLLVQGHRLDPGALSVVRTHGPAALGIVVWLLLVSSLRAGLGGGPLAPERADVLHLLLAPVSRGAVLRRSAMRWLFTAGAGGVLLGATLEGVSQARLGGSVGGWIGAGVVAGLLCGLLAVAPAMVVSGLRLPRLLVAAAGAAALALSGTDAAVGTSISPLTWIGAIALWPLQPIAAAPSAAAVAIVAAITVAAAIVAPRAPIAALDRRAGLAELLVFTAQMLDLRGFLRLRMVLANERARGRPWARLRWPSAPAWAAWQRHARSLLRWPAWRIARVLVLTAIVVGLLALTASGSSYLILAAGVFVYFLAMDLLEPWWQEVEHPGLTDRLPQPRGWLLWRHLVASLIVASLLGGLALAALAVVRAPGPYVLRGAIAVVPAALGGLVGSAVRSRPEPSFLERLADEIAQATVASQTVDFGAAMRACRVLFPIIPPIVGLAPLTVSTGPIEQEVLVAVIAIAAEAVWFLFLRALPLFEVA